MSEQTHEERALELARRLGLFTAREASAAGIHHQALTRLARRGELEKVERGTYRLPDHPVTEHHGLVMASLAAPKAVVCLLSALSFHHIGTQQPPRVWLAIERNSRKPRLAWPPLEIVQFSGRAFREGVDRHVLEGREVKVYSLAKTLADLFKFRNTIGVGIALEALRDAWSEGALTVDELEHYARICRVERVIRPYLESVVE